MTRISTLLFIVFLYSCTSLDNGLIAFYPLDGNSKNKTKNKLDGLIVGNVKTEKNRHGESGKCLEFSGRNSYLRITNNELLVLGQDSFKKMSISLWFNSYGDAGQYVNWIIAKGMNQSSAKTDYGLAIHNDAKHLGEKKLQWSIGPSSDTCAFTQLEPLEDNKWYFIVLTIAPITKNSGVKSIYVNGELYHQCNYYTKTDYKEMDLLIGAGNRPEPGNAERFFKGRIDDIKIYDRIISKSEILNHYKK